MTEPNSASEQVPLDLSPTEDLVMEVLAARYRLGEYVWTFDSRQAKAINSLALRGLATPIHGIVEHTVRAALTDNGRAEYVTARYRPPVLADIERLLNRALDAGDRFGRYSEQWADAIQDVRDATNPIRGGDAT